VRMMYELSMMLAAICLSCSIRRYPEVGWLDP
jgi:hypothetical protein